MVLSPSVRMVTSGSPEGALSAAMATIGANANKPVNSRRLNERMITLINDLLNVTRIEEGRYIYDKQKVNLEDMAHEVIESLRQEMVRRKIKFGLLTPPSSLPLVEVDVEKIKLVIQNLLDNAVKYTPVGGSISMALAEKEDGAAINNKPQKAVELRVQDSGVGVPEDQKERIFSRFFRGANIVRLDTTGTGLGLFIAKNIIDAHGGKIGFESREGEGSTFFFSLSAS